MTCFTPTARSACADAGDTAMNVDNGLPVGDGQVGPIAKRLLAAWSEMVGVDIVQQALDQQRQ